MKTRRLFEADEQMCQSEHHKLDQGMFSVFNKNCVKHLKIGFNKCHSPMRCQEFFQPCKEDIFQLLKQGEEAFARIRVGETYPDDSI